MFCITKSFRLYSVCAGSCNVDTGKMLRQCQAGPNDVQTGDLLLTVKNAKYSARLFIYLFYRAWLF
jgi:hypothetical protein